MKGHPLLLKTANILKERRLTTMQLGALLYGVSAKPAIAKVRQQSAHKVISRVRQYGFKVHSERTSNRNQKIYWVSP